jgi:hypothetical protein
MLFIVFVWPAPGFRAVTVAVSLPDRVSIGFQYASIHRKSLGQPASTDRALDLARQNNRVKNLPASALPSLPAAASLQGRVQILVKSGIS